MANTCEICGVNLRKNKQRFCSEECKDLEAAGDGVPVGQYEHSIVKHKPLNQSTVAMLAGNALLIDELTAVNVKLPFDKIKLDIHENCKRKRKEQIKQGIFEVFGINEEYFKDVLKQNIPNPLIAQILEKVAKHSIQTGILLVGIDGGVAKISEVNEQGYADYRSVNFHAIGSGQLQAVNSLMFQKHSKTSDLRTALYNVYKAKRFAEVSVGVGKETELHVLSASGVKAIESKDLKTLEEVYEKERSFGAEHADLRKLLR